MICCVDEMLLHELLQQTCLRVGVTQMSTLYYTNLLRDGFSALQDFVARILKPTV